MFAFYALCVVFLGLGGNYIYKTCNNVHVPPRMVETIILQRLSDPDYGQSLAKPRAILGDGDKNM